MARTLCESPLCSTSIPADRELCDRHQAERDAAVPCLHCGTSNGTHSPGSLDVYGLCPWCHRWVPWAALTDPDCPSAVVELGFLVANPLGEWRNRYDRSETPPEEVQEYAIAHCWALRSMLLSLPDGWRLADSRDCQRWDEDGFSGLWVGLRAPWQDDDHDPLVTLTVSMSLYDRGWVLGEIDEVEISTRRLNPSYLPALLAAFNEMEW